MDTNRGPFGVTRLASRPGLAQFAFVDLLKFSAAQLIVLHHLAFYGPMADHVRPVAQSFIGWLDMHGRIAVQVFLVIGGFLAAKSLFPCGYPTTSRPVRAILRRYLKLAPPFFLATLLTVCASAWARRWMTHDSISALPDIPHLLAHALLLHGIAGFDSISAGAWYVAIDFQLYGATVVLAWLTSRIAAGRPRFWSLAGVIILCVAASLFYFNRNASLDEWAPYFYGSYGLGILAWWASDPAQRSATIMLWLTAIVSLTLAALLIDFRIRIAIASLTACSLVLAGRASLPHGLQHLGFIHYLGQISYSVFLVHFGVCLIVNAAFTRFFAPQPVVQAAGLVAALAACIAAGAAFHRWVETPLDRLFSKVTCCARRARLDTSDVPNTVR